ncbi:DHA2 family efflux MFS transporter permease subunit [Paenibacillus psychroresistens]|uniref:DHA2 family efflux MFS transporter permease subunit n=1 Tax=Paenibacillus psychroresistens TaxID=1778678 RepID=A0A6B8RJP6_9BACL|nr:DHA2 family efflux MFS transporter permease subunit [Paenibacillus psychroresistens]QGQ95954.1 DHA2 family efflux MFS transporter permease subunit [Paenibacillus psychroresistens]
MAKGTQQAAVAGQEVTIRSIIAPLLAVIIGMIMVILDSTIVNVALPGLVTTFDSTLSTMQWTITGYTLALSAVIPLAGWMTDRFGAKRIYLFTIAFFTLGSLLCSLAQTPEQLIIFRIIQGIGGGMVAPIGMAMIFKLAPPGRMGAVMGVLGVPMLLAPALGPIISGWLIEFASWHWIFLINLPVGIIGVLVGLRYLPNVERKTVPSLDIIGMILGPIAFASLAYGVSEGGRVSWTSTEALTGLIVGGVALILFIIVELRQKQPLLELRVFRSSDFTRGIVIAWITQIAMFGAIVLIPYFLQSIRGYSSFHTGLIMLPQALAAGIFMPIGGRLFDKIGARPLVMTGLTTITVALFLLSQVTLDTKLFMVMLPLFLIGSGMGLSMMAINTHVLQSAPRRLVSRVTPLTTAAQQVMVSFAVAGLTGYLSTKIADHMAAGDTSGNLVSSSVNAFGDTFFLAACIAAAGAVIAIILRKPKTNAAEEEMKENAEKADSAMMMGH